MTEDVQNETIQHRWERALLGDLLRIRNGHAFRSKEFRNDGVPLVRQSNLAGDTVDLSNAVYLSQSYLSEFDRFTIKKGDILIGMSGSIGKLCVYDRDFPALQNQRTGMIDLIENEPGLKDFLWWFMHTVTDLLRKKGKDLGVQNVSASDIESLELALPPLNEQRRIVAKIEALQRRTRRARTALDAIPPLLEKFRQSVLASAFRGDSRPTGAPRTPTSSRRRSCWSEFGRSVGVGGRRRRWRR